MGRVGVRVAVVVGALALVWTLGLRAESGDAPVTQLATAAAGSPAPVPVAPTSAATVRPEPPEPPVASAAPPTTTAPPVASVAPSPTTSSARSESPSPVPGSASSDVIGPEPTPVPPVVIAALPPTPGEVGTAALELVRFDWRSRFVEWEIHFEGARDGLRALTFPSERRIEVFVRAGDTPSSIHRVLAHEIGHLVDVEVNSEDDRNRWRSQRGIGDSVSWWPDESKPDFATGAGDFAEAFAVWETGVTSHSTVAGQPDAADLALLEELALDRAG